ncbi:MRP-L47-domain-containing protein, partial [Neoconidiobolus thromboides FSU 785]
LTSIRSNQSRIFRGLEEFFENGTALPKDKITTGRSWRPDELRLKSFEDLHKLWFVNLKEKNLLATQKAEAKKYQISEEFFSNKHRYVKVRKNMARILTILNERRIQWELAQKESK